MPPTPAMKPEIMKTRIRMRGDADAGAARRLGVATDGVDVAAERRPLRDVGPEEQEEDDHRAPASGTPRSWLQIATTSERDRRDRDRLRRRADTDSGSATPCRRLRRAPRRRRRRRRAQLIDAPRSTSPQSFEKKYVRGVVDPAVLDDDRAAAPSVRWTTPCQASRPASVTTNDGTPMIATNEPWKAPISVADERARRRSARYPAA